MYKQTLTNFINLPQDAKQEWLDSFDTVIIDCDKVLWKGSRQNEASHHTINFLQNNGKHIYFFTKSVSTTRRDTYGRLMTAGFRCQLQNVISMARSTAEYLKSMNYDATNKRGYVIGLPSISEVLAAEDIETFGTGADRIEDQGLSSYIGNHFRQPDTDVGAVIVGYDECFNYAKMLKAKRFLQNPDCLFLGLNYGIPHMENLSDVVLPGSLAIIHSIEATAHRKATMIGLPEPNYLSYLFEKTVNPKRTLIVGNSCKLDILLGYNCQCQTMLVAVDPNELEFALNCRDSADPDVKKCIPDLFLHKLGDFMNVEILDDAENSEDTEHLGLF